METCDFSFRLTLADWRAFQKEYLSRLDRTTFRRSRVAALVALALVGLGLALLFRLLGHPPQPLSLLAGLLLVMIPLTVRWWTAVRSHAPESTSAFFCESHYTLDAQGIRVTQRERESFTRWSAVREISCTNDGLYLWIDRTQAFIFPWQALPAAAADELVAAVERWRGETPTQGSPAREGIPAAPLPASARETAWISGLLRLLTLRRAPRLARPSGWQVALLAVLGLLAWVALDRLRTGPDAFLMWYSVPALAWYGLALLAVAGTLAMESNPHVPLRSALAILLVLTLALFALATLALLLSAPRLATMIGAAVAAAWSIGVLLRLLDSMTGRAQPRAVTSACVVAAVAWALTEWLYVDAGVWYSPEDEVYADYGEYWDRGESLLFEQPGRIDAAIANVAPSRSDGPAAFFLGFAGYGEERVFAEEIGLAARVIGERYDTEERAILLLNDRRDLESQPIATVASLRYALQGLARKMDVEEDVLFLSLSSHGSEHSLSVTHGPLMLDRLTDEALAAALRDSTIRWRVIVISACHAGSFIDALRDPNTVIITAAAAGRMSFGCSDERDLTYFGEAFYRDALPGAPTLRAAFDEAVRIIGERERREGMRPSRPQAHFGEAIEDKLSSLTLP